MTGREVSDIKYENSVDFACIMVFFIIVCYNIYLVTYLDFFQEECDCCDTEKSAAAVRMALCACADD